MPRACPMNEVTNEPILSKLERRLGRLHARQRLGIERDHEAQIFGQGINFFHIENWPFDRVAPPSMQPSPGFWRQFGLSHQIRQAILGPSRRSRLMGHFAGPRKLPVP